MAGALEAAAIDAHQHFWRYQPEEYDWITAEMPALRRDYGPTDLEAARRAAGVAAAISVQARASLAETEWLLELAAAHGGIAGVVGWAPLAAPGIADILARLGRHPALVGLRHGVQDEADPEFLAGAEFNRGLRAATLAGLTYDLLLRAWQLPAATRCVDAHPDLVFVLDHLAKPLIKSGELDPWRRDLRRLAERPNVYAKLSGLVTEADWRGWSEAQLQPYWDTAIEAFGPERLMFGSDWPVLLLAADYAGWIGYARRQAAALTESERAAIFGGTARRAYRLGRSAGAPVRT